MMRKIFSFAMAAVLLMAGCAKDNDSLNAGNESVEVIFTADLPIQAEVMRAGEGNLPTEIVYVVYDEAKTKLTDGTLTVQNKTASLTLDLIKGEKYNIAFWAQASAAPFTFDKASATVKADYSNVNASDEALDAFYAVVPDFVVSGPVTQAVKLTRPFAQINLGVPAEELQNAENLGVTITKAQIAVTNVATKLDLFSGAVSEREDITFKMAALPTEKLTVENTDYEYLAYTYLFVEDTDATDLTYCVASDTKNIKANTVPAINFKRNYRTNILGRLITSEAGFDITIEPGDLPDHESIKYQSVSTASGLQTAINDPDVDHIVLQGDIDLSDLFTRAAGKVGLTIAAGDEKTIDLHGFKISDASDEGDSYSMIDNKGTLTILDSSENQTGKLSYDYNGPSSNYTMTWGNYTITNSGKLTIESGTVENISDVTLHMIDAIDNHGAGVVTINGGTISCPTYVAIRLFASSEQNNNVVINGGKIEATWAIFLQNATSKAPTATLDIIGGEIDGKLFLEESENFAINISGGEFIDPAVFGVVAEDAEIALGADMALESTLTLSKDLTLDLNGYTLSGVCNAGQGHLIMVNNGATLNVKDSSAEADGKITFAQGTSNVGWTIDLEGELNLYSGTIELTGDEWSIGYAVDVRPNAWGKAYTEPTTFNMYGGKLLSSDGAVRVASTSADGSTSVVYDKVSSNFNMEGGEILAGYDGVFIQQSNAYYDVLNVNISGGKIKSTAMRPLRVYGPVATTAIGNSKINISGGDLQGEASERAELVEGIICLGGGVTANDLYFTEVVVNDTVVLEAKSL